MYYCPDTGELIHPIFFSTDEAVDAGSAASEGEAHLTQVGLMSFLGPVSASRALPNEMAPPFSFGVSV